MQNERNVLLLCGAAFCMAVAQNAWLVGLPFAVKGMAGTDMQVAWCASLFMGVYCTLCALGVRVLDRLPARRVLMGGAAFLAALFAVNLAVMLAVGRGQASPRAIAYLIVACGLHGLFLAAYWPPLMAWVSLGQEGAALSRRLGFFNGAWSSGAVAGPFLGGYLVEWSWHIWVWVVFGCFVGALIQIVLTRPVAPPEDVVRSGEAPAVRASEDRALSARQGRAFLWASRAGLVLSMVFVGAFRTHLPILFKYEFGYTESQFGTAVTLLALTNFATFVVLGRWHGWHRRIALLLGAQALVGGLFVVCLAGAPLGLYHFVGILVGVACALIYASHQFYASQATARRSSAMAAHEFLLGFGFMAGAIGSGWLGEKMGRAAPYWFGGALLLAITAIEASVWAWRRVGKGQA